MRKRGRGWDEWIGHGWMIDTSMDDGWMERWMGGWWEDRIILFFLPLQKPHVHF